jgi:hypothetical protein
VRRTLAVSASLLIVAAALAGLSGASFSAAKSNPQNTFTAASSFCSGGSQTITASKDAYVDQALATLNFGTANSLLVQPGLNLLVQRTLVQFNLPSTPAFCSVTAATLRLYATSAASGRTIQASRASASWTETGVTWNNQPGTTGSAANSASGAGLRTWDVTSQVQAMYSGTNNGLVLKDSNEAQVIAQQQYQSREATPDSQDPQLVVTFG